MDIITGLSALTQAITITKELRELDSSFDKAVLKSQLAELYSSLADAKMSLSDAKQTLHEKEKVIASLKGDIDKLQNGDICILCGEGRMKVVSASQQMSPAGRLGVQDLSVVCQNDKCDHRERRVHDPHGALKL